MDELSKRLAKAKVIGLDTPLFIKLPLEGTIRRVAV